MDIKEFASLTEVITRDASLTEQQKEEKLVQMADLHRFIKSYNSAINLAECQFQGKINVITEEGKKKGILFYDLKGLQNDKSYRQLIAEAKRNHGRLKELWLVFVRERDSIQPDSAERFIREQNIAYFFDRLFLFDFLQSEIHLLN
ncbi:hypothetical protein [Elizabethkingia meningoseptica]|uniref:hypothetical protein n=1 Tax=Elizabethkingia meningoseptica TaxID=238 RepID=UPI0020124FA6|nr:hypothetical protein [Elizabethkingia meningoseptica]MCL1674539.1 hypothetical protein [Elizabethkingia meningoseptica]MCL1686262.1 hypothetical protein [Elizabethkingia meningoseptica]